MQIDQAVQDGTEYLLFHPLLRCWLVGAYDDEHFLPGWYSDTMRTFADEPPGYLPERFHPKWYCDLPVHPLDG